ARALFVRTVGHAATPLVAQAAGNLGTDGRVLVWTEGAEPLGDGRYRDTRVMMSPYATRAEDLVPRRVAGDPNPLIGAAPWVVGCGRAAHAVPGGVVIVDLNDGRTNELPRLPPEFQWGRPLALSCGELFTTAFNGKRAAIVRLPLGF